MLLEVSDVCKEYRTERGWLKVLDHAHVEVDAGQIVGLIGSSGSGKSTLARMVVGLETADAGTMAFEGESCDLSLPMRKRSREFRSALAGIQMVFQHPAASFSARMRIGEGVAEGVAYQGFSRGECKQMALDAIEQVGLPRTYAQKYPWELSGGECQRAALARAIVGSPKLLVCDEPTSALDVTVQAQIVKLIARLCRERDMACLFISHDLALVRNLCSRAFVIDGGSIVEEAAVSNLFDNPQADATKRLLAAIASF